MKLQDRLPDGVTVDGMFYRLDFDFRNVLRMMKELSRDDVLPDVRVWRAVRCLTKRPRKPEKVLAAVKDLLFDEPPEEDAQKVTDFEQDAGLIRAAFMQAYHIDLYHDRLHWLAFVELLNAIPEGSRYAEVIGIRVRPMPAPTKYNADEREWLSKAKAQVALHMSDEEQRTKYQRDVASIAAAILAWVGDKDG